jgi:hypothetical protein
MKQILPLKMPTENKSVPTLYSLYCAIYIIKQLCVGIYRKNVFNSITNQRSPQKNSKTTRDAYLCLDLTTLVNNMSIHLARLFL